MAMVFTEEMVIVNNQWMTLLTFTVRSVMMG